MDFVRYHIVNSRHLKNCQKRVRSKKEIRRIRVPNFRCICYVFVSVILIFNLFIGNKKGCLFFRQHCMTKISKYSLISRL